MWKCDTFETKNNIKSNGIVLKTYWNLKLYNEDEVTNIKQVPDFPLEQFCGIFGGVIGLGGKLQVVFQFLVFFILCIGHLFSPKIYL